MSEPAAPPPPPPSDPPPPVDPPPPATPPGGEVAANRTLMIVLSYLWLLALIPLLVEKNDKEVQWHARHGLVLLVAEVAIWILLTILTSVLGAITGGLGCLLAPLSLIVWIGILIVHIMAIMKGVNGQRFMLPGISQYADKINI